MSHCDDKESATNRTESDNSPSNDGQGPPATTVNDQDGTSPGSSPEPPEPAVSEADASAETAMAGEKDRLQKMEGELDEAKDRFLRLAADFENYRKRIAREQEETIKAANIRLIRDLLEIVDNFERALSAEPGSENGASLRKGIELIYSQLAALLNRENVTAIMALGQPFDPNLHEAIMQTPSGDYPAGAVCQEIQKGYQKDNRVVRHARVIVSSGPPAETPPGS
jgi:molecular chaperone GrpE